MTYGWAALLGAVQGLTEFLPVSSSAHLAMAEHWGLGEPAPLAFDLALHAATLLVAIGVFARDWLRFVRSERIVLWWLLLGSVPAAVAGLGFRQMFEVVRDIPASMACALLLTAWILAFTEARDGSLHASPSPRGLAWLGWKRSLWVGASQAFALTPGISRSGWTMMIGRLCGLSRDDAVRFSFCLMIPAVGGAALLEALKLAKRPWNEVFAEIPPGPLLAGMLSATLVGWVAVRVVFAAARRARFHWFAVYCALFGLAILLIESPRVGLYAAGAAGSLAALSWLQDRITAR